MSTSMTPYSPQTRAVAPSTRSAVFSSMPKPQRTPARSIATTSRPRRPRLMKCWSTMPWAKKPRPLPRSRPCVSGSSVTPCTTASTEVPPRIIGSDMTAAPALEPATRPGSPRMAARSGVPARDRRYLRLVATGEVDAAAGGDPGDGGGVEGEAAGVAGGERDGVRLEAVGAEDGDGLGADGLGLGGGGGEDEDAAAGEAVHLAVDGDVAVFEPPADQGEAAGRRRCHGAGQSSGTMRTPRSSLWMR